MRIAKVIGTVTLSRPHPSLAGYRFVIGVPYSLAGLKADKADGEDLVILDEQGAGFGMRIGFSESGEAAAVFHPEKKPIDAYCGCLIDSITLAE
jgi:ethanolamine utilization protein EutN